MLGLGIQLVRINIFQNQYFRAVESDSYILRSANKGISAIINNKGQVIKGLKNNETGNLEYKTAN